MREVDAMVVRDRHLAGEHVFQQRLHHAIAKGPVLIDEVDGDGTNGEDGNGADDVPPAQPHTASPSSWL